MDGDDTGGDLSILTARAPGRREMAVGLPIRTLDDEIMAWLAGPHNDPWSTPMDQARGLFRRVLRREDRRRRVAE